MQQQWLLKKHTQVAQRVKRSRGKASWSNHLRKQLRLDKPKLALIAEFHHHLTQDSLSLAQAIKRLRVPYRGLSPIDQAISVAGGVPFEVLDDGLMLRALPGVFCAGEMLDWEAPTGGYLLTASFATGHWAGKAAARYCKYSKKNKERD